MSRGTMGRRFVGAIAATLWVSASSFAVDDLSLNVTPPTTVAPGGTVTVTLDVANLSAAINGAQIRIQYTTSLMTLVDVVPNAGPGWTEVSQSNISGAVDWAAVINGGSTSANGTIATMTFTVIAEGSTSITFRADAPPFLTKLTRASDNGTILPNKTNSGTITLTCSDGLFCNGLEPFSGGACQPSTNPCVDGVACTVDACNEGTDSCTFTPNDAFCSNGLFCDGVEFCHLTLGCQDGPDPNCNDSVACTVDTCNEATDSCDHALDHAFCSNGLFCDGAEVCNLTLGCQDGPDPNCNDGVACTVDTCNETTDTCDHALNHAFCNNGLFCDGVETCDSVLGCVDGPDPCLPAQFCNDTTDTCDQCSVDGDCNDNNICTSNACVGGACVYTNLYNPAVDCCNPITGVLTTISDGDPCTSDACLANGSVTHTDIAQIDVALKLQAVSAAVTRDVQFVITNCGGAVDTRIIPVAFSSLGNAALTLNNVDADADWIAISEGHTLRRLEALSFTSCLATADVSGANLLLAGDFHTATVAQDNLDDIVDFSILASRWNQAISTNSSIGADATGNGLQNTADFTAIQVNYFVVGEAVDACALNALDGEETVRGDGFDELEAVSRDTVSAPKLHLPVNRMENPEFVGADMNRDGVVDVRDIRLFAQRNRIRLLPDFEKKLDRMERSELRNRQGR